MTSRWSGPEFDNNHINLYFLVFGPGASIVISSTGPTLRSFGSVLGQFDYDEETKSFKQKSTLQNEKEVARYLFQQSDKTWRIGKDPNVEAGWFLNQNTSSEIPQKGWEYFDNGYWPDSSITISAGEVKPCPAVDVQVLGAAKDKYPNCCHGVFNYTDSWVTGRAFYRNEDVLDKMLHVGGGGRWAFAAGYGGGWIKSSDGPLNPADATNWVFWDGTKDSPADIKIQCIE